MEMYIEMYMGMYEGKCMTTGAGRWEPKKPLKTISYAQFIVIDSAISLL